MSFDGQISYCVDSTDSSSFHNGEEFTVVTNKNSRSSYVGKVGNIENAVDRFYFRSDGMRLNCPATIFIADLGDPHLILSSPLPIQVEQAGERVAAYSYDLDELAVGPDRFSAIDEMKASIVELFGILKEEKDNLGPIPQRHWSFLKKIIKEVN